MTRILVTSPLPADGKSAVTVGLAASLRRGGSIVHLARARGGDHDAADAVAFTFLSGVRSPGEPIDAPGPEPDADADAVTVIELASPDQIAAFRDGGAQTVVVTRFAEADDETLARLVAAVQPLGLVVTAVPPGDHDEAARIAAAAATPLLGAIPQDRLLAAPVVTEMAAALEGDLSGAESLYPEATEWLQIGPITAHGGADYFRRFADKTVITRYDKTDVALSALDAEPACLILTGGEPTLPYVAQRAESEDFALIVTTCDTPEAVRRIGDLYGHTRFTGARKMRRAADLVQAHLDLAPFRQPLGLS